MTKVLFFQYGNYAEAYLNFQNGGSENYRDQRKSVDHVAALAERMEVATVAICHEPHEMQLADNLSSKGILHSQTTKAHMEDLLETERPDLAILRTPSLGFLQAANRRRLPVLPNFADIFLTTGPRSWWTNLRFARALRQSNSCCVSNHNLNASLSMTTALGVNADRIVPWDWDRLPILHGEKSRIRNAVRPALFYAGPLTEDKGVGDCLRALAQVRQIGIDATMSFAGGGNIDPWMQLARQLGIAEAVHFLGIIPNARVREEMHEHDIVVVPSRHSYPEGLPNTIYEGLASHSPLIISDHPAFRRRLRHGKDAVVFKAGSPDSLGREIRGLVENQERYRSLSSNASQALDALYFGLDWTTLIDNYLDDPHNASGWVEYNSLHQLTKLEK